MSHGARNFLKLCFFLVLSACATNKIEKTTERPEWSGRMQNLAHTMVILYPLASEPAEFKKPENKEKIESSVSYLASLAHDIKKVVVEKDANRDVDPGLRILAGTFGKELDDAAISFRKGDYDYSRASILGAINTCIQCHSRKPDEKNQRAVFDAKAFTSLKPLYRADLQAASRQFDEALNSYMEVFQGQNIARNEPVEWEKAVQRALYISVRVKLDPQLSEKIVDTALQYSSQIPHSFVARIQAWKNQIKQWKGETPRLKLIDNDLDRGEALIDYANKNRTNRDLDFRPAFIQLLRASSYLHSYIQRSSDTKSLARAYLLLGQCYNTLKDPGEVGLTSNYYKSCILIAPATDIAMECYDRYEDMIYGEAIRGATSLPVRTIRYLENLKDIASPDLKN